MSSIMVLKQPEPFRFKYVSGLYILEALLFSPVVRVAPQSTVTDISGVKDPWSVPAELLTPLLRITYLGGRAFTE